MCTPMVDPRYFIDQVLVYRSFTVSVLKLTLVGLKS